MLCIQLSDNIVIYLRYMQVVLTNFYWYWNNFLHNKKLQGSGFSEKQCRCIVICECIAVTKEKLEDARMEGSMYLTGNEYEQRIIVVRKHKMCWLPNMHLPAVSVTDDHMWCNHIVAACFLWCFSLLKQFMLLIITIRLRWLMTWCRRSAKRFVLWTSAQSLMMRRKSVKNEISSRKSECSEGMTFNTKHFCGSHVSF